MARRIGRLVMIEADRDEAQALALARRGRGVGVVIAENLWPLTVEDLLDKIGMLEAHG